VCQAMAQIGKPQRSCQVMRTSRPSTKRHRFDGDRSRVTPFPYALAALVVACGHHEAGKQSSSAPTASQGSHGAAFSAGDATKERPPLRPLADVAWLESLSMPAGRAAFVSVPLGATEPRPIMVGMHGAGDRPEWACGGYRGATDAFPFIVCPRGLSHGGTPEKYWSPGAPRIEEDIESAVAAVRARFGAHVAEGPLLYAGFSLGASQGAQVLADEPKLFSAALLVEGGVDELTPFVANTWAHGAGTRALLVCGIASCRTAFGPTESALRRAGIETLVVDTRTGRHNLDGEMTRALRRALPWLVRDDPRWKGFVDATLDAGAPEHLDDLGNTRRARPTTG